MELETIERVCDYCESVLSNTKKDYLSVKGSICLNQFLEKTNKYNHLYVSNRNNKNKVYDFCNLECFSNWVTHQRLKAMTALYKSFVTANEDNKDIKLEHYGLCKENVKLLKDEGLI